MHNDIWHGIGETVVNHIWFNNLLKKHINTEHIELDVYKMMKFEQKHENIQIHWKEYSGAHRSMCVI